MSTVAEYTQSAEFQQAQEQLRQVLERSATDMEFRARLVTDPRAALAEMGHNIPETLDVRFIEPEGDATIVLPKPVDPQAELSEAELEAVAGGVTPLSSPICSAIVLSATISYITAKI